MKILQNILCILQLIGISSALAPSWACSCIFVTGVCIGYSEEFSFLAFANSCSYEKLSIKIWDILVSTYLHETATIRPTFHIQMSLVI